MRSGRPKSGEWAAIHLRNTRIGAIHDLFEHVTKTVIPVEAVVKAADRNFFDDLFESEGSPDRNPHRRSDPGYALLRALIDVAAARISICGFPDRWRRLVRWRINLDEKLDLIRAVEWHYGYVFRERVRLLLNEVLKHIPPNSKLAAEIGAAARTFKKRTDPSLTARGRHVHDLPHHDPLGSQAATLELLYKGLWSQNEELGPKIRPYVRGRRQVATRNLRQELEALHNDLMDEGDRAVASIVSVYVRLLPGSSAAKSE